MVAPSKKPRKINTAPPEKVEQMAVFRWAEMSKGKFPDLKWLFAIPNGGSRHFLEAVSLKKEGVKPGVADICLPVARGGFHALYIELKRREGSKTTEDQKEFMHDMTAAGNKAVITFGWEEAIEVLKEYLSYPPTP